MIRRHHKIVAWLGSIVLSTGTLEAGPVAKPIQGQAKIPRMEVNALGIDLAAKNTRLSSTRRPAGVATQKKAVGKVPYSYLLPFGFAQFDRGNNRLGTALAAGQAGLLLFYFERLGQVRQANTDVTEVMRDVNLGEARNDPVIIDFLNANETYALKTQKEAEFALLGFAALYTAGVLDAIFDPFATRASSPAPRRRRPVDRDFGHDTETPENLQMAVKERLESVEEHSDEIEKSSKFGIFVAPAGAETSIGLSVQKPL